MKKTSATIRYLIAVVIYGTIGFFLHYVNASSEFVVLCRGVIGSLFIGVVMLASENLPDIKAIKNNLKYIVVSGIALGLNWV
ncbi:MAG: EamA/RhaT family transporter, partial [Firmicutes bacterium]|nr:EamA/RhaT family transporter [Candidatus Colivicinus equi]